MVSVRRAEMTDIAEIYAIYKYAREFMKKNGNEGQWGDSYPPAELTREDIDKKRLYVVVDGEFICGVFMFYIGDDDTYNVIEQGKWLSDGQYGVIHRVAGNGRTRGLMGVVTEFCAGKISHLRIDTHENNQPMRRALEKNNFSRRGIIHIANGSPRIAFEKI